MKRWYFRILIIILAVLLLSSNIQVFAATPRATNYIASHGSSLTRTAEENLRIYYTVTAGEILDQIGVYYISIQRSTDQQTWSTESTLYYFNYPEFVRENSCTHSGSVTYTGTRGYYYRANVVFFAKLDGNSERTSMYTQTVYIPPSGNGGRIAG